MFIAVHVSGLARHSGVSDATGECQGQRPGRSGTPYRLWCDWIRFGPARVRQIPYPIAGTRYRALRPNQSETGSISKRCFDSLFRLTL